ncbi:MAG TPA: YbaK/EbsC family protein [Mycobacteriales bacterium]|nr:YbaK/EbsC family protein [Mycobacteriales bacterium]
MHARVEQVAAALRAGGATGEIRELDASTRTAVEAGAALGVEVGAIVKSLVFTADDEPILVLASGDHQVDTAAVATVLGVARVRRADADLVREVTGFVLGGVAPLGHPHPLRTVIDTHLADFAAIWAAAGTSHAVFPTTYDELLALTGGTPAEVGVRT